MSLESTNRIGRTSARCLESGIFEQPEAVALLGPDGGGDSAVQGFVPCAPARDKRLDFGAIAALLKSDHLLEHVLRCVMVAVVIDAHLGRRRIEAEDASVEEPVPLHQLHHIVGLLAARPVVLDRPQYAAGKDGAKQLGAVIVAAAKLPCEEKRDEVRLQLLEQARI